MTSSQVMHLLIKRKYPDIFKEKGEYVWLAYDENTNKYRCMLCNNFVDNFHKHALIHIKESNLTAFI